MMSIVTRVRRAHRAAVVLVARGLRLGPDARRHNHPPSGTRRGPSPRPPLRHHDPARRRLLVRWQGLIDGLFS
jgi:hypothetical protein